jgi:hypothetical protein
VLSPAVTFAQDELPTVTVADDDFRIVTADDGVSTLIATVTVTGVSDPITLSVLIEDSEPAACVPLQQPIVRPGVQTRVELELPAGCRLTDPVTVEFVTAPFDTGAATPSGVRRDVHVNGSASPDYVHLAWGFGVGALVAIVAVLAAWWMRVGEDPPDGTFGRWSRNPWQLLPGLDKKWTWAESPLSSVTVLAAIFTAVLGAGEPLETILGKSGESEAAVVLVAAALAAALTAAAPLAMPLLRREPPYFFEEQDPIPNDYTVLGVLASTAMVLTGSVGLILTVLLTLRDSTAIGQPVLFGAGAIIAGLVVAYAARSMRRTLKVGMAGKTMTNVAAMP